MGDFLDNRAIGVFDSGLGGLTVVKQLMKVLPNENIIYFGDTGRVPYGSRSDAAIRRYAGQDVNFLLSNDVKLVVAACGTVSSVAPDVADGLPVPFVGVVQPAARVAAQSTRNGKIGVIGTAATIASGSFERAVHACNPEAQVVHNSCPLFVPLVESGWFDCNDPVVINTVERYLQPIIDAGVDTLILGCTHYPILSDAIASVMGEEVSLINIGIAAANTVANILDCHDIRGHHEHVKNHFFVSDTVRSFEQTASILLGENADFDVEHIDIEQY